MPWVGIRHTHNPECIDCRFEMVEVAPKEYICALEDTYPDTPAHAQAIAERKRKNLEAAQALTLRITGNIPDLLAS